MNAEMYKFISKLKAGIEGEIRYDSFSKKIYSVDASIYQLEPLLIVLPKTKEDIIAVAKIAAEEKVPIIARGGGTGLTGGCLGRGIIIDTTKYMNKILQINEEEEYAICEPGVVQNQLNEALEAIGYRLGPDTSTGNRATIGGMVSNNSAGSNSIRYGSMIDHVQALELVLSEGDLARFGDYDPITWEEKSWQKNREGNLYKGVMEIVNSSKEIIKNGFPKIPRKVSGYNLDAIAESETPNLSKLIVGAEGSLGVISEVRLKISKRPKETSLGILHFNDMITALEKVPLLLNFHPFALEVIDKDIIEMGRISPALRDRLNWLKGEPEALLIIQFDGETEEEVAKKSQNFEAWAENHKIGYSRSYITEKEEEENVWALRKSGLGLLMSRRTYSRAVAFIEDLAVAPEKVALFIKKLKEYLAKKDKTAGFYGHAGAGLIHIRPYLDLSEEEDRQLMAEMMKEVADLVLEFDGALSGEHGDGLLRTWLNKKMFGEELYELFCKIKRLFDPYDLMNPGKIVDGTGPLENLRRVNKSEEKGFSTFLDFSKEGGLTFAVDMCNGNGQCRKKEGTMCPSFQATNDEFQSTRARAQSLQAILNGDLPLETLTGEELYAVMDNCLECKGCKSECPSQIDMAKMKAEFLYHYQEKNGYGMRSRIFGNIGKLTKWGSYLAPWSNKMANWGLTKALLEKIGVHPARKLPYFAKERFSQWVAKGEFAPYNQEVVLFNDTFTEYSSPHIGRAAHILLNVLGFKVIVPPWRCCGRPLFSKGMLKEAQRDAKALITMLEPYALQGIPIIGLEPSCILMVKDDYPSLMLEEETKESAKLISQNSFTIDQFLNQLLGDQKLELLTRGGLFQKVKVHSHCHEKALVGTEPTLNVLKALPNFQVEEIKSGCCGMAGSYGYEKEHYDLSMQVGEQKLFPIIKESALDTLIVANGFSCRSQINHGTQRIAKHMVEILYEMIDTKEFKIK